MATKQNLKELLKITKKACYTFFMSSVILEIFCVKHTRCPPSWIFKNMHVA